MRVVLRALFAGSLGIAASFVVACGGGAGLLSSDQAGNLNAQLDQVSSAIDSGQCNAATGAASAFGNAIDNLPASLNRTLVNNLKQGAATVSQLTAKDCKNQQTTTTPTTTTASTSSTATQTTTTPTTQSTPPPPPATHSTPATTPGGSGTSTSGGGTGGAGLPGNPGGSSGGAGAGNGNGNGNGNKP